MSEDFEANPFEVPIIDETGLDPQPGLAPEQRRVSEDPLTVSNLGGITPRFADMASNFGNTAGRILQTGRSSLGGTMHNLAGAAGLPAAVPFALEGEDNPPVGSPVLEEVVTNPGTSPDPEGATVQSDDSAESVTPSAYRNQHLDPLQRARINGRAFVTDRRSRGTASSTPLDLFGRAAAASRSASTFFGNRVAPQISRLPTPLAPIGRPAGTPLGSGSGLASLASLRQATNPRGSGSGSAGLRQSTNPVSQQPATHAGAQKMELNLDGTLISFEVTPTPTADTSLAKPFGVLLTKADRLAMDPSDLTKQLKYICGLRILEPTRKFTDVSPYDKDSDVVEKICSLDFKIDTFEAALRSYDLLHPTFLVFDPVDTKTSSATSSTVYYLFEARGQLKPAVVGQSVAHCRRWFNPHKLIDQDLMCTYSILKNCTAPDLWKHCEAIHSAFPPEQQGGPTMFSIILHRIAWISDADDDVIVEKFRRIKLNKIPGEDVEEAIVQIQTMIEVMLRARWGREDLLPQDVNKVVLNTFKHSSVTPFRKAFESLEEKLNLEACQKGTRIQWPPYKQTLVMAKNLYVRYTHDKQWIGTKKKPAGFLTQPPPSGDTAPSPRTANATPKSPSMPASSTPDLERRLAELDAQIKACSKCFNCGKPGHRASECRAPRNDAVRNANAEKYRREIAPLKAEKKRLLEQDHSRTKSYKMENGMPMVTNKNGEWVADQKKLRAMKAAESTPTTSNRSTGRSRGSANLNQQLGAALLQLLSTPAPPSAPAPVAPPAPPVVPQASVAQAPPAPAPGPAAAAPASQLTALAARFANQYATSFTGFRPHE